VTENTGAYISRSTNSATGLKLSPRETPQSITVITRQRMDDQGVVELADVVKQTPGLIMNQQGNLGSDSSQIYSRGFVVDNYQIDGIGLVNSNYTTMRQTTDMAIYDRAEIVRGATGLMNGVGTPGATINLVRKRPTPWFQAAIKAETGSWNRYRAEGDISTPLNKAGTLRARIVAAHQENDSYIDRLHERKQLLYGIVEADIAPSTLFTAGFSLLKDDYTDHARSGLPLFYADGSRTHWSRSDSAAASWAYSKRDYQAVFTELEHSFDNDWKIKGTFSHAVSHYDEMLGYAANGYPDRTTGAGLGLWAGRWSGAPVQDSLDIYANGSFQLFGRKHELVAGAAATRTRDDAHGRNLWRFSNWSSDIPNIWTWNGDDPAEPDNPRLSDIHGTERVTSAYVTARFRPTDALSLIVGARNTSWENRRRTHTYASGAVTENNRAEKGQLTPYFGVVFDLDKNWSIYGSYTDIFKPQSLMAADGSYLDPLLGKAYELGLKAELFNKRLDFALAAYLIQQDNFGVQIPGVYGPDGNQAYRATSGTETRGFEVEVSGEPLPGWQLAAGFTRNNVKDRDGHALNTNIPQNTFKLFSTYRLAGIGNGLILGGGVRWQNKIWSDNAGPAKVRFTQNGYAVVDLMAHYPLTKQITLSANLYNATDERYYATTTSSYYGEPRSFMLTARYQF
jgi:outer membrane receptor for ferric coprogen and ferric-rhodotorulic acid